MTIVEVKSNICHSEECIEELQRMKKKVQEQMFELEMLKNKCIAFQQEFRDRLLQRKNKISLHEKALYSNRMMERYIQGMQELLEGSDIDRIHEELWEAERQIRNRIIELETLQDEYDKKILYQKERRDYWWNQLSIAMAKEGDTWSPI